MSDTIIPIEHGKNIIAKFMGWHKKGNRFDKYWTEGDWERSASIKATEFKYHENWNQLMPVVEKIEKDFCNEIEVVIYSASCYIHKWNAEKAKFDSFIFSTGKKIEAVYNAVVEFIEWYNNQK